MTNISIHTLPTCAAEARKLALRLNVPLHQISVHTFPDGELGVTAWPASSIAIVYATLDNPNEKLLTLMFAADSLRRNGCTRLILVAPYLCYMRQDIEFHPGDAISQQVIGDLLALHFDRIITIDAHLHRTHSLGDIFRGVEADNLSAVPTIASYLTANRLDSNTVVVGPDEESRSSIIQLCSLLHSEQVVATKERLGDSSVQIILEHSELLAGHPALIVDDIVSSGATIETCARAVIAAGASSVDVIITHALFSSETMPDLLRSGIRSIRSTTSVPHFTNAIALDQLLADALASELPAIGRREHQS